MPQLIFIVRRLGPGGTFIAEIPGIPEATVSATTLAGVILGIQESWEWWINERRNMLKGGDDPAGPAHR